MAIVQLAIGCSSMAELVYQGDGEFIENPRWTEPKYVIYLDKYIDISKPYKGVFTVGGLPSERGLKLKFGYWVSIADHPPIKKDSFYHNSINRYVAQELAEIPVKLRIYQADSGELLYEFEGAPGTSMYEFDYYTKKGINHSEEISQTGARIEKKGYSSIHFSAKYVLLPRAKIGGFTTPFYRKESYRIEYEVLNTNTDIPKGIIADILIEGGGWK